VLNVYCCQAAEPATYVIGDDYRVGLGYAGPGFNVC